MQYCLFKINEKNPSIVDFLFFSVVPKSYQTVTPEPRYVPNRDICVPRHPGIYIYTLCATYTYIYTLTGHFIRYTLLVPVWTRFCLQNCFNSSWHRFNKVVNIPQRFWSILTRYHTVAADLSAAHPSPVPPHPKGALMD